MADWGVNVKLTGGVASPNWCRAMGGQFSGGAGQVLTSVNLYMIATSLTVRLAVYQGGDLATGPDGATLVWDAGTVVGGATEGWQTATHPGPYPALTNDTPTWIAFKSNDALGSVYYSASSGDAGDFQSARGRYSSTTVNIDETVAWPSTWPSDTGAFSAFWYSVYLTYQAAGGAKKVRLFIQNINRMGLR